MTKVEAIKFGTAWLGIQEKLEGCEMYEFFKMSVKALQEEPCDDCVRRQEVLDILKDEWNKFSDANDAMQESIDTIEALKPVTPKPKTGHWITKDGKEQGYDIGGIKTWYIQIMCDKCGFIKTAIEGHTGQYKFCPNCGAKMESEGV